MLHNGQVNLELIKKNVEEALFSKLLMMGQGSGRAEMHAIGFVALKDALDRMNQLIDEQKIKEQTTEAKAPVKKDTK